MTKNETLTITMTGRAPVKINKTEWPIVASAKDFEGEHDFQSMRDWTIKARRNKDGRAVVYGVYTTQWQREKDKRCGYLLDAGADIAAVIERVAEEIGGDGDLAARCVADLPAEEI